MPSRGVIGSYSDLTRFVEGGRGTSFTYCAPIQMKCHEELRTRYPKVKSEDGEQRWQGDSHSGLRVSQFASSMSTVVSRLTLDRKLGTFWRLQVSSLFILPQCSSQIRMNSLQEQSITKLSTIQTRFLHGSPSLGPISDEVCTLSVVLTRSMKVSMSQTCEQIRTHHIASSDPRGLF
jgi:hypothetical protein